VAQWKDGASKMFRTRDGSGRGLIRCHTGEESGRGRDRICFQLRRIGGELLTTGLCLNRDRGMARHGCIVTVAPLTGVAQQHNGTHVASYSQHHLAAFTKTARVSVVKFAKFEHFLSLFRAVDLLDCCEQCILWHRIREGAMFCQFQVVGRI
jgi:hypothetical protein